MSTGIQYGGALLSDTNIDRERLLARDMVNQLNVPENNQHTLRGKPRKIWTYAFDWLLVIAFIIAFLAIDNVNGHQREFSLTDESIMYTFAVKETIPTWLLVVCAVILPISFVLLWTLIIPPLGSYQRRRWRKGEMTWKEKIWDANLSLLGIGLALASTITITNSFKNLVGRPRPDFLDRCQPLPGATNPTVFTLSNASICTQTALLQDGYRSFPSGHSSISFSGLGFLTLFIAGRLNVLDTRGQVWKTVITLCPLVAAGVIAVSRLMDNRHHPFDVIFGSVLGYLLAWMAYRQYFPSISTAEGGRPYSIAEFAAESAGPSQAYTSSSSPDLELGQARLRNRGTHVPGRGRWEGADTDTEEEVPRNGHVKLGASNEHEYGTIQGQQAGQQSFDDNTEDRR